MKLNELKNNGKNVLEMECCMADEKEIKADIGKISLGRSNSGTFIFNAGTNLYTLSPIDKNSARKLTNKLKSSPPHLAQIICKTGDIKKHYYLYTIFFSSEKIELPDPLNITVSAEIKEQLVKDNLVTSEKYEEDLKNNFIMNDGVNDYFAYTIEDYAKYASESNSEKVEELKCIVISGKSFSLVIREKDNVLVVDQRRKLNEQPRNLPKYKLMKGSLSFKKDRAEIGEEVKKLLSANYGYLKIWDQYAELQGDVLLRTARKIGEIKLEKRVNVRGRGIIVRPQDEEKLNSLISVNDYLIASDELPEYIKDENITWSSYMRQRTKTRRDQYKILEKREDGTWLIESDKNELPRGFITYSILGDEVQIRRRRDARELIENGQSAMPDLGLIIEGIEEIEDDVYGSLYKIHSEEIEPLSPHVLKVVFKGNKPTPQQEEAIRIALNTPDIAIIQGPPGTGKTTVIAAIIERLNELAVKGGDIKGQVLVTSYQHDAVKNVIDRLNVNSLPTRKFGGQNRNDGDDREDVIEKWCSDYKKELKNNISNRVQNSDRKSLYDLLRSYQVSPSDANALNFLKRAKELTVDFDIRREIDELIDTIRNEKSEETFSYLQKWNQCEPMISTVRGLRCSREGFFDDGAKNAEELYNALRYSKDPDRDNENDKKILETLEKAKECGECPDGELLEELRKIKQLLLEKYIPEPDYKLQQQRPEIVKIYNKINKIPEDPKDEVERIRLNLLRELEYNTPLVISTVTDYSFVYAATAQQCEGYDIKMAKDAKRGEHPVYETVIIDEAARSNPCDLMIPMAQAERRIILVGDHRQLPHMYDEEIFDMLKDDGLDVRKEIVMTPMFKYLKDKLENRKDSIKRTITLKDQYRMPKELGDFISENFYGENERFNSPLSSDHQNCKQELWHCPYKWVKKTYKDGRQKKDGKTHSYSRECEADYIVETLAEYLTSEEGKELTYGVISFYRDQVNLIKSKLDEKGLSDKKVQVGSVDAFQGMEFDVIFLSVVRTAKEENEPEFNDNDLYDEQAYDEDDPEFKKLQKLGIENYGFLTVKNRLCVALSRQKRLLIVVGDPVIFTKGKWGILAQKTVPAMKKLVELCEKKGAMVDG